jgi:hypothetical protein
MVTVDGYGKAWKTAAVSAGLLGITTSLVLIAMDEPAFSVAVLVLSAAAAHVQARMRANGVRPPAELTNLIGVFLAGIASAGLLRLLGPVAWALVTALAVGAVPLLRQKLAAARDTR